MSRKVPVNCGKVPIIGEKRGVFFPSPPPTARTPRLERHGAPFSVCTGLSPWCAPRRNVTHAHRMAENRKENYSRKRSFCPFHERDCSIFPFHPEINRQNRPHVQKNTYLWPTYLCVLRTARPQRASPTQITSHNHNPNMKPANGKLGVMIVGLGAVSTTFITGVLMARKGLAKPVGAMTQYDKNPRGTRCRKKIPEICRHHLAGFARRSGVRRLGCVSRQRF